MSDNAPKIVIKSEEKRLVYGEVYAPMRVDTDDEAMTADEIERMAHDFLARGKTDKIDVTHNYKESGCVVVESFIARKQDSDGFVEGSWVVCAKIIPDELWSDVKKGEINGFSFAGSADKEPIVVEVKVVRKLEGETEKSETDGLLPPHSHEVKLAFDDSDKVIPTYTSSVYSHKHEVLRTTATEKEMSHSHRLVLIDN